MSSEGKKKRGESGMSNAKSIAFRYGGSKCDYSVGRRAGGGAHPRWAGTKLVQGFDLAMLIREKHPFEISHALATHVDAALANCTKA